MSEPTSAEVEYAVDMDAAGDFLRVQLDMAQAMPNDRLREMLEDEILVEYLATVYAIYHAYLIKTSPRHNVETWLRVELRRAVRAIEPSPDGLERIRAQIEHTRDKGGKTTNGDLR